MRVDCENCEATFSVDHTQLTETPLYKQCPYCGHTNQISATDNTVELGLSEALSPTPFTVGGSTFEPEALDGLVHNSVVSSQPSTQPQQQFLLADDNLSNLLDLDDPTEFIKGQSSSDVDRFSLDTAIQALPGLEYNSDAEDRFALEEALEAPSSGALRFGAIGTLDLPEAVTGQAAASQMVGAFASMAVQSGSATQVGSVHSEAEFRPSIVEAYPSLDESYAQPSNVPLLSQDLLFSDSSSKLELGHAVCSVCGVELEDEFDQVIGLCEKHQNEREDFGEAGIVPLTWFVAMPDGSRLGPFELEDLRQKILREEVPLTAEVSSDGARFGAISSYKELGYLAALMGTPKAAAQSIGVAPSKKLRPATGRSLSGPAFVFSLVVGILFFGYFQRETLVKLYSGIVNTSSPSTEIIVNPLRRYRPAWIQEYPNLTLSSREYLDLAQEEHIKDTWEGYKAAEDAYRKAILLDEDNFEAVAGYIENAAIWRYVSMPFQEVDLLKDTLSFVFAASPQTKGVYRAQAALALAESDLGGCRSGADQALLQEGSDIWARLILAECYITGNVGVAIQEAERVYKEDEKLARAARVLAHAYSRAGLYVSAEKILGQRIKKERSNGYLYFALGQVKEALAKVSEARKLYGTSNRLSGDRQAAWLRLGQLELEAGRLKMAEAALNRARNVSEPHGLRAVHLFSQTARINLLTKRYAQAAKWASKALSIEAHYVPALLVQAEAEFAQGFLENADAIVNRALKINQAEPAALVLAAQISNKRQEVDKALKYLHGAVQSEPKNAGLHALLAAQYLMIGKSASAYTYLRKTIEIDPARVQVVGRRGPLSINFSAYQPALVAFSGFFSGKEKYICCPVCSSIDLLSYWPLGCSQNSY